jgi:hypothetical protein
MESAYPSMVCKEIRRNIEEISKKKDAATMNFSEGNDVVQVKATNIQSLVKIFARRVFKEEKIDHKRGK